MSFLMTFEELLPITSAVGIGLMVGLERERKKGDGEERGAIGLRTCAVTALAGYVAMVIGGIVLLSVLLAVTGLLLGASYLRSRERDPGLTSEMALLLTACLGALCRQDAVVAVALAVILTLLLAMREPLHHFAKRWLTSAEARDGLILLTAVLVILPVLPDTYLGPDESLNPRVIWKFTVLLMVISAIGHLAVRLLGASRGLALAGFFSGFASSTATIASMGVQARSRPDLLLPCVTGAVLSTVATIVQMGLLLLAAYPPAFAAMQWPLLLGGLVAVLYGVAFMRPGHGQVGHDGTLTPGSIFDLRLVGFLTLMITVISWLAAALLAWHGEHGVVLATAIGGFADAHSSAISTGSLAASGRLPVDHVAIPVLAALSTNTLSKAVVAWSSGGRDFFLRVVPGQIAVLAALWAGLLLT